MRGLAVLAVLAALPAAAWADDAADQAMGEKVLAIMQAHSADLATCQRKARAADLHAEGELIAQAKLGSGGKPATVTAEQVKVTTPLLTTCALAAIKKWDLSSLGKKGDVLMLPLRFGAAKAQYAIAEEDAPLLGPKGGQVAERILVDATIMTGAGKASLSRLSIKPRTRLGFHTHASAELLYVLHGQGKVEIPGKPVTYLPERAAIYIPAGQVHSLEAVGGRTPSEFIQIFAPGGPEVMYRDPKNHPGTTAITGKPENDTRDPLVASADEVKALPLAGGKAKIQLLFEKGGKGDGAASLELLTAQAGAEIPEHVHADEVEIVYISQGQGTMTLAGERIDVKPGMVVHVPAGIKHAFKVTSANPVIAVQSYGPAGPEQRFKTPPAATPPSTPKKDPAPGRSPAKKGP